MLRIATLNVWFDSELRKARTKALLEVIRSMGADIFCLQEVIPGVAAFLVRCLPGWQCSDPGDGSTVGRYGVMAVAAPGVDVEFSFHDLPGRMGRRLLVAQHGGLAVGTVHLESLAYHPVREAQLRACEKILAPHVNSLLIGDFNFDSQRNFTAPHKPLENEALTQIMPQFVDLWPALRPQERGLTFDSGVNPYIRKREHMRYDRIMTRLSSWHPMAIDMFAHEAVDHLVQLSPSEKECAEQALERMEKGKQCSFFQRGLCSKGAHCTFLHGPCERKTKQCSFFQRGLCSKGVHCAFLHGPCERNLSSQAPHAQTHPQARADTREQTPPQAKSKFFLSDHFGLIATLAPIGGSLFDDVGDV